MRESVAIPAVRQKRSKLAPTSCQASSTSAVASGAGVVIFHFMALPFFVESAPRAYRLKAGNADPPISTSNGTSPRGRSLTFTYDSYGRLATMTAPDNLVYSYGYESTAVVD